MRIMLSFNVRMDLSMSCLSEAVTTTPLNSSIVGLLRPPKCCQNQNKSQLLQDKSNNTIIFSHYIYNLIISYEYTISSLFRCISQMHTYHRAVAIGSFNVLLVQRNIVLSLEFIPGRFAR